MEGSSSLSEAPAVSRKAIPTGEPPSPIENFSSSRKPDLVEVLEENENGGQDVAAKPQDPPPAPRFVHIPGFPHFVLPSNQPYQSEPYASSLFASGHGYATFTPETVVPVPDDFKTRRGISIGDVGILSRENDFIFAFNVFLAADHPYHKNKTPDSFHPLAPLSESEISTTVDFFPRGSVVASKGVEVTRHSEEPLHLTFRSSEPRGAVLILPEGATRQNISISTNRLLDYVSQHAVRWALFFAQSGYLAANGSVYIVTGVDKTSECSMLSFPTQSLQLTGKMSAMYRDGELVLLEGLCAYRNRKQNKTLTPIPNNLCVFMRGIRVGLGRAEWIENVDETPEYLTPYTQVFCSKPRLPLIRPKICVKGEDSKSLSDKHAFSMHPFHPSDAIAQIMFALDPEAAVVLVDDSIWSIFYQGIPGIPQRKPSTLHHQELTFICSRGGSFDDFRMMIDAIFNLHDVMKTQGVLSFVRNSDQVVTKDAWYTKLWFWLTGRRRLQASDGFKELLRQGQFHIVTNDDVR